MNGNESHADVELHDVTVFCDYSCVLQPLGLLWSMCGLCYFLVGVELLPAPNT